MSRYVSNRTRRGRASIKRGYVRFKKRLRRR